jgi:hypothetical protein
VQIRSEEAFEDWQEISHIGDILHEVFCPYNNIGGCGWYYCDWTDPESIYHWYLLKAKELADVEMDEPQKLNQTDVDQVSEALKHRIAWAWWPEKANKKAVKLLSLVGNDREKALAIIEEHKHR